MILKSVSIRNFACLLDVTLNCEPLAALVGPNGCGKSSLLRALQLFYETSPKLTEDDFYDRDTTRRIEITVTFRDLSADAKERFAAYVSGTELAITRTLYLTDGKLESKLHGIRLQSPDFERVRGARTAAEARQRYSELRQTSDYSSLPAWQSQSAADRVLRQWEEEHPERCQRMRDGGQFFGFSEVAEGYLGRFSRFIYIPAVRDATEDAADGRSSPIAQLMNWVVRAALAADAGLRNLSAEAQRRYSEIMAGEGRIALDGLQARLSSTLQSFVPDSGVSLLWQEAAQMELPVPRAELRLIEDGYTAPVFRCGHGLQRALVLTLLQHLEIAQLGSTSGGEAGPDPSTPGGGEVRRAVYPDLVLAVEEPELYQHPNRQRHLSRLFFNLAEGTIPGVLGRTQILYSTHSPLFVDLDRFRSVRVLRKSSAGSGAASATSVTQVDGDDVAWEIQQSGGPPSSGRSATRFTWETLRPRLQAVMTPWMNEGFFAHVVVLVEGEEDRAAILGMAAVEDVDFEKMGVSVIPCGGKTNLDKPLVIFRRYGVRTYVIWDGDRDGRDANPALNRALLRLAGQTPVDWPETQVRSNHACFEQTLQRTVSAEIGPGQFDEILGECQHEFGYAKRDHACKNPVVFGQVLRIARDRGHACSTIDDIVSRIVELANVAP